MKLSTQIFTFLAINLTIFSQFTNGANPYYIHTGKSSQCTSMIRVINQTVAATNTATNFGTNGNVQTIEELVRVFDKAVRDLNSVNLSDEKLKTYKGQFLIMYQSASTNNKQLAINIKKRRSAKVSEGLRRSRDIFSPERDLTTGLNIYCNS
jgi:hypothetical protein